MTMTLKKSVCILMFSLNIAIPGLIFAQASQPAENDAAKHCATSSMT